jgi:hypothetical protein
MRKIILLILLILVAVAAGAWYSMQTLPSWAEKSGSEEQLAAKALSDKIRKQGFEKFLGSKAKDVLNGEVRFDDVEFNAILLSSLKADEDGRKLLSVSDAVRAFIKKDNIEITAIINLDKLEKVEPKARKAVEQFDRLFPFLNDSRVALTVYATPVARKNQLAVKDDFHIKVGAIPISNDSLRALGAKVERANTTELGVKYLSIKSVLLEDGEIILGVVPRL